MNLNKYLLYVVPNLYYINPVARQVYNLRVARDALVIELAAHVPHAGPLHIGVGIYIVPKCATMMGSGSIGNASSMNCSMPVVFSTVTLNGSLSNINEVGTMV